MIYVDTATKKGIKEGDLIWVEGHAGKVKGRATLTECIHPEVVGIAGAFGHWADGMPLAKGKGTHFNSLLSTADFNRIDMLACHPDHCVKVKVCQA